MDRRIVAVLGASNVSLALPDVLNAFHRRLDGRAVDYFIAHGPGRSYGGWGGFLCLRFPPHVQGALADALVERWRESGEPPVDVLVTDVGNDIGAGVSSRRLSTWLEETIGRFSDIGARIAVTALPVASLHEAPAWKFHLLRRLYFPLSCVPRRVILRRVCEVQARIEEMAGRLDYTVLDCCKDWYWFDAIHLAPRRRGDAFRWWADALLGQDCSEGADDSARLPRSLSRWSRPFEFRLLGRSFRWCQTGVAIAPSTSLYLY